MARFPAGSAWRRPARGSNRPGRDIVAIRFFPEGAATGGRIVLSRERAAWQIDVEWLTGEVTVKRTQAPP